MGYGKLGVAAGLVSFSSYITLEVFQAQDWSMPDPVAAAIVALMIVTGVGALLVVVFEGWKLSAPALSKWRLRSPLYNKDAADPHQWLHQIASEGAKNPCARLYILDAEIGPIDLTPDKPRPWVRFDMIVVNAGVYDVFVGAAYGRAHVNSNELADAIDTDSGVTRIPRGQPSAVRVLVHLPQEFAKPIHEELASKGTIKTIGLSGIRVQVTADCANAVPEQWGPFGNISHFNRR